MKRLLLALAVVALVSPATAGEKYNCDKGVEDCLNTMVAKMKDEGYAGVELEPNDTGHLVVKAVLPDSPAERIGVRKGDVIVSLDGRNWAEMTEEEHHAMAAKLKPGTTHDFTVERRGKTRSFKITLEELPPDVLAKYVGKHMVQHVDVASN